MSFNIEKVTLRIVNLPQIEPFRASFGSVENRDQIILEVQGGGISGWGESAVLPFPYYNHECPQTVVPILRDFAVPLMFKHKPKTPQALHDVLDKIVGNRIAKAGLEIAYWDWFAKSKGEPLWKVLGGKKQDIKVGISVPLYDDLGLLLEKISGFLEKGYQKIKIKIAPGEDIKLVQAIVDKFNDIPLMVDGNSAYSLDHIALFKELDNFQLMMIEQPLREDDILDHAALQKVIRNPICLDESIDHVHDAAAAIALGSCKIINIKTSRVGGLTESIRIHDYAQQHGVGVWCGGMLESGIGRATNLAISSLPNYLYPGDIGESLKYYREDIIDPVISLSGKGVMQLSERPGIGYDINFEALDRYTKHKEELVP